MKFQLAIFDSEQYESYAQANTTTFPRQFTLEDLQKTNLNEMVQCMVFTANDSKPGSSHHAVLIDAETKAILCNINHLDAGTGNSMMPVLLKDSFSNQELFAVVRGNQHGITIQLAGHGDANSTAGSGEVLWLELAGGQARVHIYEDINREEPTSISLDGAKESALLPVNQ